MIRICPSILNADFENLPAEIAKIAGVADLLHLDVMDNKFVPNFTFSPETAAKIIATSPLLVDVHLMVADADNAIMDYLKTSAASLTVHFEACENPKAVLRNIRSAGKRAGIAVKPNTPIDAIKELIDEVDMILVMTVEPGFGGQSFMDAMMPKVETARRWLSAKVGSDIWLQVDGGISLETIAKARKSGADTFVAGSSVYKSPDPAEMVEKLRKIAAEI